MPADDTGCDVFPVRRCACTSLYEEVTFVGCLCDLQVLSFLWYSTWTAQTLTDGLRVAHTKARAGRSFLLLMWAQHTAVCRTGKCAPLRGLHEL